VLAAIVRDVVAPNTARVAADSRALRAALVGFVGNDSPASLRASQKAFRTALLSWKRLSTFKSGPVVETNALLRAMFWPARPRAIESALADPRPVSERRIEELGADAKGLFAIEYVMYAGVEERAEPGGQGSSNDRRRQYLVEAATSVVAYAERTERLLGDGALFARTYAAAERSSLEQLLAHSIDSIEVVVGRIARIVRLRAQGTLRPTDVEGYYSKTSLEIALALLAGIEGLYLGSGSGGVTDLVSHITPSVDARVRTHFAAARDALSGLGAPLEEAARTKEPDLVRTQAVLRTLEVAMKTEVTSALGVSVTFSGSDGD
jgi:predicted lipoprotein